MVYVIPTFPATFAVVSGYPLRTAPSRTAGWAGEWECTFDSLAIHGSWQERPAAARRTVVQQDDTLLSVRAARP